MGITAEQYARLRERLKAARERPRRPRPPAMAPSEKKRRPWIQRAPAPERTSDGIVFGSKAEMLVYEELRAQRARGEIPWFIRQPKFDLAGVVYTADFLVGKWSAELPEVVEVKGGFIPEEVRRRFVRNAKQMKEIYGFEVLLWQR